MLDQMRKHSRSFIIYIFFGIIIAVFVVNFGPQSAGCTASTTFASKVSGTTVSPSEYAYVIGATDMMRRLANAPESILARFRGQIMDEILRREILADEALALGFRIPDKEIDDMIVKGSFLNIGRTSMLPKGETGEFDYDLLARYLKGRFGLTVKKFKEIQRREMLAEKMLQLFVASVKVSEEEVKSDYLHENTQVALQYVRFVPTDYRDRVQVTPAKLKAFQAANKDKIKKYFEANKTRFDKLPRQVRLRLIKLSLPVDEAQKEAIQQKSQQVLARIKAGEAFEKVAAEVSEDTRSKVNGGLLDWRKADDPGLGDEVKKALGKLKAGQTTGLVATKDGVFILKAVAFRKGGKLTLAQASEEIAEEMIKDAGALEQAKEVAAGYLKQLSGEKKFSDLFKDGDDAPDPSAKPDDDDGQPKYKTTTSFSRSGRHHVPGIGVSKEITAVAFKLKKDEAAKKAFVVGERVYILACGEKQEPDMGEWTKEKDTKIQTYVDKKAAAKLQRYAYQRCKKALDAKKIRVNRGFLVTRGYTPSKKDQPLMPYVECESLKEMAPSM